MPMIEYENEFRLFLKKEKIKHDYVAKMHLITKHTNIQEVTALLVSQTLNYKDIKEQIIKDRLKKYPNNNPEGYAGNAISALKKYTKFIESRGNISIYPDTLEEPEKYSEGAKKQVIINAYERNPEARAKCIEHYGATCQVCAFDFYKIYGKIGEGFIHVHHLIEIHTKEGEEYEVDPIKDLIPICPNCHAMIHKKNPAYTIEEIRNFIS